MVAVLRRGLLDLPGLSVVEMSSSCGVDMATANPSSEVSSENVEIVGSCGGVDKPTLMPSSEEAARSSSEESWAGAGVVGAVLEMESAGVLTTGAEGGTVTTQSAGGSCLCSVRICDQNVFVLEWGGERSGLGVEVK